VQALLAMSSILLSSFVIFRRFCYEVFAVLHYILAAITIAAVWMHTASGRLTSIPTIYLLVAVCVWVVTWFIWLIGISYRNLRLGKKVARAVVKRTGDVIQLHVKLPRSWDFKAGQYVNLCVPGMGFTAFIQWHPFMISWWYQEHHDTFIILIIRPRRGFTARLGMHVGRRMLVFIDGPYGKELQLCSYGTVLLFASGIGIVGQLPCVKQLLKEYQLCKTSCRRIALFWEMDQEGMVSACCNRGCC
jgi:predicted ferric reductase